MLLSVIVPCYKVEAYVQDCVDSIVSNLQKTSLAETEYEVLLVDDGSPDNSGALCDQLAAQYACVAAYHKPNGGLSDARNYGMERARGDYLVFCDSDDKWSEDPIEPMIQALKNEQPDVVFCGIFNADSEANPIKAYPLPNKTIRGGFEAFRDFRYYSVDHRTHICSTAFSAAMCRKYDLWFDKRAVISEDVVFCKMSCWFAEKIMDIDLVYYIYRDNPHSIMHKKRSAEKRFFDMLEFNQIVKGYASFADKKSRGDQDSQLREYADKLAFGNVYEIVQEYCCESLQVKRLQQLLKENHLDYAFTEYKTRDITPLEYKRFSQFDKRPHLTAFGIYVKNKLYVWSKRLMPITWITALRGKQKKPIM